jgi:hypothetical protein
MIHAGPIQKDRGSPKIPGEIGGMPLFLKAAKYTAFDGAQITDGTLKAIDGRQK